MQVQQEPLEEKCYFLSHLCIILIFALIFFLFNLGFWFVCLPYFFQGGELSETGAYQRGGGDGGLEGLWNVVVI